RGGSGKDHAIDPASVSTLPWACRRGAIHAAWWELLLITCPHRHVAVTLNVMRSWRKWRMRLAIIARSRPARITGWTLAAILALAAAAAYGLAPWRAAGGMHATTPPVRYTARVLVISVGGAVIVGTGLLYTARNYRLSRAGRSPTGSPSPWSGSAPASYISVSAGSRPGARHARLRRSPRRCDRGAHRIHPRPCPPPGPPAWPSGVDAPG